MSVYKAPVLKNPAKRNQIAALFRLQLSDEHIAKQLGVSVNRVVSTRLDMGLKKPRNPNPVHLKPFTERPENYGGRQKGCIETKRHLNKNRRVNKFVILRAYLDQPIKNMSEIARRFKCTRSYVSAIIIEARGDDIYPGILNERNQLYIANNDVLIKKIMGES